jgi:DNA polymerase III subunit epsilon
MAPPNLSVFCPFAMLHDPFVVLDFETTGLQPERGDRITEVGLVRVQDGRITDRFESLVNCGVRVPPHITAFTGITQRMVDGAPDVNGVMRQVAAFIGEDSVVSHNATFDQRFFIRECRLGHVGMLIQPFICTLRLARRAYPELRSHSLAELVRALGLTWQGTAHRAAADAEVTAALLLRLGADLAPRYADALMTGRLLRKVMATPVKDMPLALKAVAA